MKLYLLIAMIISITVGLILWYKPASAPGNENVVVKEENEMGADFVKSLDEAIQYDFEVSYNHTVPGEYSEVYAMIESAPGEQVTARIKGPSVIGEEKQTVTADENGQARFVWKIGLYGEYLVSSEYGGGINGTRTVVVK
jgi:hypothetical protein